MVGHIAVPFLATLVYSAVLVRPAPVAHAHIDAKLSSTHVLKFLSLAVVRLRGNFGPCRIKFFLIQTGMIL